MIEATRKWFRRNRYPIAIGASLIGVGYLAGQYVLGKLNEARQRMSDERIAKDNLRRRFTQNQEDCTYTILGLLPTVTDNVLRQLPVEDITTELQARRSERLARGDPSTTSSEIAPSELHEARSEDTSAEGTGSFVHASQMEVSGTAATSTERAKQPSKSKSQLWQDLKMLAITRVITLLYTLSLLSLLTRIQLNLLGRRNYLSSVVSLAVAPVDATSSQISLEDQDERHAGNYNQDLDTNRKYLTFSWWLLHRGWRQIMNEVERAVQAVFGAVTPRDAISFSRLSELILEVRKSVEGSSDDERRSKGWLEILLPAQEDEQLVLRESGVVSGDQDGVNVSAITPSLRRLLDETSDIIESPTFSHVLTAILDAAFSLLVDEKIATLAYKSPTRYRPWSSNAATEQEALAGSTFATSDSRVQELPDVSMSDNIGASEVCKLATILAVFTKQAHVVGSGGDLNELIASTTAGALPELSQLPPDSITVPSIKSANEYLAAIEGVGDLEAFAAVIYSSNFELDRIDSIGLEDKAVPKTVGNQNVAAKGDVVDAPQHAEGSLEVAWSRATESRG